MSVQTIKETENGQAFELKLSDAAKSSKPTLITPKAVRNPLSERMDNAQRIREDFITGIKDKAKAGSKPLDNSGSLAFSIEAITEKLKISENIRAENLDKIKQKASMDLVKVEKVKQENQIKAEQLLETSVQRIKSAESKRSSLLQEKIQKAAKETEKVKQAQEKKESMIENVQINIVQKIEQKVRRSTDNYVKHIEKVKETATKSTDKLATPYVEKRAEKAVVELEKRMTRAEVNRQKNAKLFEERKQQENDKRQKVLATAKEIKLNNSVQEE